MIGTDEVLEARNSASGSSSSSLRNSSRLVCSSSMTASIAASAPSRSSTRGGEGEALERRRRGRPRPSLPERTARSSDFSIFARVCSARSSSTSTTVTSTPERAQTSAIPEPMRPPPITPTRMAQTASTLSGARLRAAGRRQGRRRGTTQTQLRRFVEPGSIARPAPRSAAASRASVHGLAAVVDILREGRLRALRVDVDDVVHVELPSSLQAEQPRRYRLRGKSGHHRAGWSVTPTRGNPRESATENTPPTLRDSQLQSRAGKVEMVR